MRFVSRALKELSIRHSSSIGSRKAMEAAVTDFKTGTSPILILSSEESVSGLNLTEATHIVIFHPFLVDHKGAAEDGEESLEAETRLALSMETQGIARAWRGGQTGQIEVVRFLMRDSIEEELFQQRGYKEGMVKDLEGVV